MRARTHSSGSPVDRACGSPVIALVVVLVALWLFSPALVALAIDFGLLVPVPLED